MARLRFSVLVAVAIGGVLWAFHPERLSPAGWIVLGGAGVYGVLSALLPERLLRRRIGRRPPLLFDEIYRTSFQQLAYPRSLIEDVWNQLARDLGLEANKLRPSDRFAAELSVKGFPLVDLSETVDARLKERLRNVKTSTGEAHKGSSIVTLRDYVEVACRLESQRQGAAPA